jgi:hypothetical protein
MPILKQQTKPTIQNVCALRGVICGSDHRLVKSKIIFTFINKKQIRNINRGNNIAMNNTETLKYLSYVPPKVRMPPFCVQRDSTKNFHKNNFFTVTEQYNKMK